MTNPAIKRVCIIGAGPLGISAAYYLSKSITNGPSITVIEASSQSGGLAGSHLLGNGEYIEAYYHHIFKNDKFFRQLSQSIGVSSQIFFRPVSVGHYFKERVYDLGGPKSILAEPLLRPFNRLRFLFATLYLKLGFEKKFINMSALKGSKILFGEEATCKIWEPLLQGKFGDFQSKVPMSWLASRIRDRSIKLGYFRGGFHRFYETLEKACSDQNIRTRYNTRVASLSIKDNKVEINGDIYDACLSTIGPVFEDKLVAPGSDNPILYLGAICVIYEFNGNPGIPYWTNYCDPSSPVLAVISHRELENSERFGNCYPVYTAAYLKPNHELFQASDDEIVQEFYLPIQRVAKASSSFKIPKFIKATVYRTQYAQPLINPDIGFPPVIKTDGPLYSASMHSIYPNDRGQNYAIELGKIMACKILEDISAK